MPAPPLLLINGYAATAADWDPTFIAALERSFELILPDNRGVGAAPLGELDGPLTIEAMAADLESLLDARVSPAVLAAQVDAMEAWHAEERPPPSSPAPPVLIAHGSEDIVIPPENSDRLAALWSSSRLERVADGGHAFMAQEPERLADLISSFLLQ